MASKVTTSRSAPASEPDLRSRLEQTRLELRALFQALDQLGLAQQQPVAVQRSMELDADLAEALWVLDQPRGRYDLVAMTRDTLVSLDRIGPARQRVIGLFDAQTTEHLLDRAALIRATLRPDDAYLDIREVVPRSR